MARTAINLYSVRELDDPMLDVIDYVADAGYDGVQFSGGLGDATPEEAAAKVEERGLGVVPAHVGLGDMEDDRERVVETYGETLGCSGVVVPWMGEEHFEDADAVAETADRLGGLADDLAADGLDLHYHNHDHEFVDFDDTNGFEAFAAAAPDVFLEVDVGWVQTAGHDPVALLDELGDRAPVVHMKDMTADGDFVPIGEGAVDMQGCADVAREHGAEWLVYEHDAPEDPRATIDHGAEFLDSL